MSFCKNYCGGRGDNLPQTPLFMLGLLAWMMLAAHTSQAANGLWSGHVALESRLFLESPAHDAQRTLFAALAFSPEYYQKWQGGKQSVLFAPYLRLDAADSRRTHWDIRELDWVLVKKDWELHLGIRKVFWGVTESQHLVDVINQTDGVESADGEDKLGQPMANVSFVRDWGTLDLFVLPGFRTRTFPGPHGRLRAGLVVDDQQETYESSAQEHHVDFAARWSQSMDIWDVGLSHFSGTSRDPIYAMGQDEGGRPVLVPHYAQMEQSGLSLQMTLDAWLWKLEAISRQTLGSRYTAATGGFEYTLVGVTESGADLGLIGEYLFDDRGSAASTPFENDIMLGARLTANDIDSSEMLVGGIIDPDSGVLTATLEAATRLGQNVKLSLEGRVFTGAEPADLLFDWRRDSGLQAELAWYF